MRTIIFPSNIQGEILAPASKSSMQRACAAALLSHGTSVIHRPGKSNDDLAALDVIQALGATVNRLSNGNLEISSHGIDPVSDMINCGESGLGIRMFSPLAALSTRPITITGSGSLVTRPMNFFDEIFPKLGIEISSDNGKLPLHIRGPLTPADIEIDGSLSSQFLTGLLMAFAAAGASDKTIKVIDLKSKPYIDLTLEVMRSFGVEIQNKEYKEFYFPAGNSSFVPASYTIESDWSGGAFLLVAGAIAGRIVVRGLNPDSTQADKAILSALSMAGASMSVQKDLIEIGPAPLKAFHFDATDCPDLFPPLVALASFCEGVSSFEGVLRLTHKESNRSLTLQEEFGKMGVQIELKDDIMLVHGGHPLHGAEVHSHHDHRIAMACAVAGLSAVGETKIDDAEAISKSYPDFYDHLIILGALVHTHIQTINS